MAKTKYKKRSKKAGQTAGTSGKQRSQWKFPLQKENGLIILAGAVVIIIGYALMGTAISDPSNVAEYLETWNNPMAVTVAPVLLVIGYCVLVPLGLMWRKRQPEAADTAQ